MLTRVVSRRALLGAALSLPGVSLAASCRDRRQEQPPVPGAAALDAALADEERLLAAYDALFATHPALLVSFSYVRAHHTAHRDALLAAGARPLPPSAGSASASTAASAAASTRPSPDPAAARRSLAATERAAAKARTEACLTAPRALAPLFGSLAASEGSHAVGLAAPGR
jgi:hypothetical protein